MRSKRGVGGGYVLARPPSAIRLSEILSAVDGPISLGDFGEPHQDGACDHEGQCVLLAIWKSAGEQMRRLLDGFTLQSVADAARGDAPWPEARQRSRRPAESPSAGPNPTTRARRGLPAVQQSSTAARSAGSGDSKCSAAWVTGWRSPIAAACRNGRGTSSRSRIAAVGAVADHRMADGGEVHADLVGAPGLQAGSAAR